MAQKAFEGTFACPAAIAIHNDGDMLRNFGGVELLIDGLLLRGELMKAAGDSIGGLYRQNNLAKTDASTLG